MSMQTNDCPDGCVKVPFVQWWYMTDVDQWSMLDDCTCHIVEDARSQVFTPPAANDDDALCMHISLITRMISCLLGQISCASQSCWETAPLVGAKQRVRRNRLRVSFAGDEPGASSRVELG